MELKVAVYRSHHEALNAVNILGRHRFPLSHVSVIGKAELIDDHLHITSKQGAEIAPAAIGAVAGTVAGILTGIGIFAIPGFGFLYGAGAVVGALGGFDVGLIGGGILSILTGLGIKNDEVTRYEEHMHKGDHLLMVKGSLEEIEEAEHILHTEGTHLK